MRPPESRFTGCLIGQCVGDAVGFVVEGAPPDLCRAHADAVLLRGTTGPSGRGPFVFGQYSDDSQLARELMQSFAARGRFDPADGARRIAALFAEGRGVGGGWATAEAAARLAAGVPWEEAGTPPPNAGNGSAMRAGPIGLMFCDDSEGLIAAAEAQGRITHADPRCSAGAVAVAGAVALALANDPIEPKPFARRLADWAGRIDGTTAALLRTLPNWLALPPEDAAPVIAAAGRPDFPGPSEGLSGFVIPSVLWSLYSFLRTPDDWVTVIHTAVRVGGDVDTTAAMAGAITGARNGLDAIPRALVDRLTDRGSWRAAELIDLAKRVWRMKFENRSPEG